jgi:hypothetical protein
MLFGRKNKDKAKETAPAAVEAPKPKPGGPPKGAASEALNTLKEQAEKVRERKASDSVALQLEEAGLVKKASGPVGPGEEQASAIQQTATVGVKEGFTSEEDLLQVLSEQIGMPYVRVDDYEIDQELLKLVPGQVAQMYKVFPLERQNDGSILLAWWTRSTCIRWTTSACF